MRASGGPDREHNALSAKKVIGCNTACYDPIAPDRYDDERIGVIYALHRNLFSHAHQTTYRLDTRIDKVTYVVSRLDLTTDHMIRALALHPYIFERGEDVVTELVKRIGLSIVPYSAETLQDELRRLVETVIMVQTQSGYEERPKDPPLTLCRTILAKSDRMGLRKLDAIIGDNCGSARLPLFGSSCERSGPCYA